MSVEHIANTLLQLPHEERRRFADWFYEHEEELAGNDYVHPEVKAEVLRRREEVLAHPEMLEPVTDEWFDQLKRKLADARSAKASAR